MAKDWYFCHTFFTMSRERQIYKVTIAGGLVNIVLLALKFAAGIIAGSAAMIADAIHSLSDFLTDIIVLVFVSLSGKPADEDHAYGHGKFETLATTFIGISLLIVAGGIIHDGVHKIIMWSHGTTLTQPGAIAFVAAILSIATKELTYHYTIHYGKKLNSPSLCANAWHHRSDAFSSISTALGIGGAIALGDKWAVLDPIAAIVAGGFVAVMALRLLKNGIDELLERSLPDEIKNEITNIIAEFPDVSEPHHLRTRRIGSNYAIEIHIRMDGRKTLEEAHNRTTEIEKRLKKRFGNNTIITIHTEPTRQHNSLQ